MIAYIIEIHNQKSVNLTNLSQGGLSIRKLQGDSGLSRNHFAHFLRKVGLSIRPFRSQFVCLFSIEHDNGSCEVGTKPLVALTFLLNF